MQKAKRSWFESFLNVFTGVQAGEGTTTLLLTLNVFLLLTAYYIIKPVRESLILTGGGAEVKSYAAAGQVLLLAGLVPIYSRLASRFPRRQLITVVTLFFMGCLILFYFLMQIGTNIGVVFYLWVGVFSLMIIAQFWSFANDVYVPSEGKRLFVIIAFGASMGAVAGSGIAGWLITIVGVDQLLLASCALLGLTIVLTNLVDSREKNRHRELSVDRHSSGSEKSGQEDATGTVADQADKVLSKTGGFRLVFQNRYLLMIAFLMLLANWVNTTGEYILGKLVSQTAAEAVASGSSVGLDEGELIGKFYSDFFLGVNILGVLLQLFLVSRIIKYLGVRVALLILPLTALAGNILLAVYPVLRIVRWTKTVENATDYSLQNTVRNVLFLPTSRDEKYKAKQAIDTFFVRTGDVLSALLVYVGTTFLHLGVRGFAGINIVLVVFWLALALLIGFEYKRRVGER